MEVNNRNYGVKLPNSIYILKHQIDRVGDFTTKFEYETTDKLSEAQRMPKSVAEGLCSALHAFHKISAYNFET